MTEFERLVIDEMRALRAEVKEDINTLHSKINKVDEKFNNINNGLSLFKGKVFGIWAVLTAILNVGMHFFGKK